MQAILLILLTFFISTCSVSKKSYSGSDEDVPSWVYSPMESCSDATEMCASGEGESLYLADLNARKSIAAIFETQITSESNSYSSSSGSIELEDPKVQEELSIQVTEKIDLILEGVEIKHRHQVENVYFALAILDKVKAWKKLEKEIADIDDKLADYKKRGKRSTLKKMYSLYELRARINERYAFLRGSPKKQIVSLADIKEIQFGKSSAAKKIAIGIDTEISEETVEHLEAMLTGFGHEVVKEDDKFDIKIVGSIKQKKEFMKVKGFEKYSITFYLVSKNERGVKVGGISFKEVSVGRSKEDAYLKVDSQIRDYIDEHIDELNID